MGAKTTLEDAVALLERRGVAWDMVACAADIAMDAVFSNKGKGWKKPDDVVCHAADPTNCRFHRTGKFAGVKGKDLFDPGKTGAFGIADIKCFLREQLEAAGVPTTSPAEFNVIYDKDTGCVCLHYFSSDHSKDETMKIVVEDFIADIDGTAFGKGENDDIWYHPEDEETKGWMAEFTVPELEDSVGGRQEDGGFESAVKEDAVEPSHESAFAKFQPDIDAAKKLLADSREVLKDDADGSAIAGKVTSLIDQIEELEFKHENGLPDSGNGNLLEQAQNCVSGPEGLNAAAKSLKQHLASKAAPHPSPKPAPESASTQSVEAFIAEAKKSLKKAKGALVTDPSALKKCEDVSQCIELLVSCARNLSKAGLGSLAHKFCNEAKAAVGEGLAKLKEIVAETVAKNVAYSADVGKFISVTEQKLAEYEKMFEGSVVLSAVCGSASSKLSMLKGNLKWLEDYFGMEDTWFMSSGAVPVRVEKADAIASCKQTIEEKAAEIKTHLKDLEDSAKKKKESVKPDPAKITKAVSAIGYLQKKADECKDPKAKFVYLKTLDKMKKHHAAALVQSGHGHILGDAE